MPAEDLLFAELERHQELLLPHTAAHLGLGNLDVGCGSGVASVIHTSRLGLSPTLSDVIDIRHPSARALRPPKYNRTPAWARPGEGGRSYLYRRPAHAQYPS